MFDFENMSIANLQSFANGLIVAAVVLVLAILVAIVTAIRVERRETLRHKEVIALLTEIRSRLDHPRS